MILKKKIKCFNIKLINNYFFIIKVEFNGQFMLSTKNKL